MLRVKLPWGRSLRVSHLGILISIQSLQGPLDGLLPTNKSARGGPGVGKYAGTLAGNTLLARSQACLGKTGLINIRLGNTGVCLAATVARSLVSLFFEHADILSLLHLRACETLEARSGPEGAFGLGFFESCGLSGGVHRQALFAPLCDQSAAEAYSLALSSLLSNCHATLYRYETQGLRFRLSCDILSRGSHLAQNRLHKHHSGPRRSGILQSACV